MIVYIFSALCFLFFPKFMLFSFIFTFTSFIHLKNIFALKLMLVLLTITSEKSGVTVKTFSLVQHLPSAPAHNCHPKLQPLLTKIIPVPEHGMLLSQSVQAAITKLPQAEWLKKLFSTVLENKKSKNKFLEHLIPVEDPLVGLMVAIFPLYPHLARKQRESALVSLPPPLRALIPPWGSTLLSSSKTD